MARSRSSGRRADYRWTGGRQAFLAQATGSSQAVILTAGNTSQTLMRTRGTLVAFLDGVQTGGELLDIGIAMLVQQAGATATSLPLTDPEAPFFYYDRFAIGYEEAVSDVVDMPGLSVYRATIDVKAMRVIRPDQEVILIVEAADIAGNANANISVAARFLLAD